MKTLIIKTANRLLSVTPNMEHRTCLSARQASSIAAFVFTMLLSFVGFSQAHVTMSLKNIKANSNTIEYDLYIVNDGNTALKLSACSYGVNFDKAILNGGTLSSEYISNSRAGSLNGLTSFAVASKNEAEINQVRMTTTPSKFDHAITLIPNVPFKVGRFIMANSTTWTKNSNPSFALQEMMKVGTTTTQIVGYIGTSSKLVALTPTYKAVSTEVEKSPILNPDTELQPNIVIIENTSNAAQVQHPSDTHSIIDEKNIKLYPNPVINELNIDLHASGKSNIILYISDMNGRLIRQVQTNIVEGSNRINIDVSEMLPGVYTLQLDNGKEINFKQKFEKQ